MGLNLESKISLNSASFEQGIHRIRHSVADIVKDFAIGAIGISTVGLAVEKTVETFKDLANQSRQLGMTTDQIQILKQAAKDAGKDFEELKVSLSKLDEARAKALGGDKKVKVAFEVLGINQKDLLTKTAADLFTGKIADQAKAKNIEEITQPMREILGRGAANVVGILHTDFNELGEHMRNIGAIIDGDTAAKLKVLSDEFELVSQIIISRLGPAILALSEFIYQVILKGAGKVANAAGFAGVVEAHVEAGPKKEDRDKDGRANLWKFLWREIFDSKRNSEAIVGGEKAESPFTSAVKEFEAALKKAAEDLKTPKPDFTKTEAVAKKMADKKDRSPREGDALIKVGNFLGASKSAINNAQAMLQHAAATADNTRQILNHLRKFGKIEFPSNNGKPNFGLDLGIHWPSN